MIRVVVLTMFLFTFFNLETSGQAFSKEYWKELSENSKVIVVGRAEEYYLVGQPKKLILSPENPNPSREDIYKGRVFRVKVTETLKGKIKTKEIGENKYVNIFLYWIGGVPGMGNPVILEGKEYVLFLEPNNDKELEGKSTIEFSKPNYDIIAKPFDYKSSYVVAGGFRGVVTIKTDKNKLIKEIKKSF